MKTDTKILTAVRQALFVVLVAFFAGSCADNKPSEKDIVKKPEQLSDRVRKI